jgi:hypothetical protein
VTHVDEEAEEIDWNVPADVVGITVDVAAEPGIRLPVAKKGAGRRVVAGDDPD